MMLTRDDKLYQKAYKAYVKDCRQRNAVIDEPSVSDCTMGRKYVTLRNSNRELAKYDINGNRLVG